MTPRVERIDPDPAALVPLAERALAYDADEAGAILARLGTAGHTWLSADGGLAIASAGHLDLIAVDPAARRRGIGTALVRAAEDAVGELVWSGHPPRYGWPGVDVRYTPAVCLAESLGYEVFGTARNMTVDLAAVDLSTVDDEKTLAGQGVELRREAPGEWIERTWNASWRAEAEGALGCHSAWRDGAPLAFAAYGANRPSWFGPMGTDPAARSLGLGRVLLRRCLADQRDAGLSTAQIGWVGPIAFYSRTVGAVIERVFWRYRKASG